MLLSTDAANNAMNATVSDQLSYWSDPVMWFYVLFAVSTVIVAGLVTWSHNQCQQTGDDVKQSDCKFKRFAWTIGIVCLAVFLMSVGGQALGFERGNGRAMFKEQAYDALTGQ